MTQGQIPSERPSGYGRRLSSLSRAARAGIVVGVIAGIGAVALLTSIDPFVNWFIRPRIEGAFNDAFPAYTLGVANMNYSILKNRFGVDSVTLRAVDGQYTSVFAGLTLRGIDWMPLLWGGKLTAARLGHLVIETQSIVLNVPRSQYELRCGPLRLSVPESTIVVDSSALRAVGDPEESFAKSAFRKARYQLFVPHVEADGVSCLELLQRKSYRARAVRVDAPYLDVLINKDKPGTKDTSRIHMPNELLASIKGIVHVDSLSIVNGRLTYGERFGVGSKPAAISFDSIQFLAEGIANQSDGSGVIVINTEAVFMGAGRVNIFMSTPVAASDLELSYSGTVGEMDARAFNPFLERANQVGIKSGVIEGASFKIEVVAGRATGSVRLIYRDLDLARINKRTGSASGFSDNFTSLLANTLRIHGNNLPDKQGEADIGSVYYLRKPDDPFIRFVWFALRSGLRDVVIY